MDVWLAEYLTDFAAGRYKHTYMCRVFAGLTERITVGLGRTQELVLCF